MTSESTKNCMFFWNHDDHFISNAMDFVNMHYLIPNWYIIIANMCAFRGTNTVPLLWYEEMQEPFPITFIVPIHPDFAIGFLPFFLQLIDWIVMHLSINWTRVLHSIIFCHARLNFFRVCWAVPAMSSRFTIWHASTIRGIHIFFSRLLNKIWLIALQHLVFLSFEK